MKGRNKMKTPIKQLLFLFSKEIELQIRVLPLELLQNGEI